MGASIKRSLRPEEVADLQEITPWSSQDIKSLWRRFVKLDRGRIGVIGSQDIMMVPEVAMNPLAQRITAVLEKSRRARDMEDDSGYMINFRSFVCTLAVFSEKAPVEDKVQFAFELYDVDGDGFVGHKDLVETLQTLVGENIPEEEIKAIAARTIEEADSDDDGKLSLKEFGKTLSKETVAHHLTFNLSHLYEEL